MSPRLVRVPADRYPRWRATFDANNPNGPQRIVQVDEPLPSPCAVLLIRRGGYAVGLVLDGHLADHKIGRRHVQSRTAAGGWSQQRFARRRGHQADALVEAVRQHLHQVVDGARGSPQALVRGGDRTLVAEVLGDPRLEHLAALPTRDYPELPDPRRAVLDEAVRRAGAYEISIDDGPVPAVS